MELKDVHSLELEDNKYIDKFCLSCKVSHDQMLAACEERFFTYVVFAPAKVKSVKGKKHRHIPVYEFKVPVSHITSFPFVRVAYVMIEGEMVIFYISKTLQKEAFVKELAKTELVE